MAGKIQSFLTKKSDQEAWSWVDDIASPSDITSFHLRMVYGIESTPSRPICCNRGAKSTKDRSTPTSSYKCGPARCKDNPNCLNYLGLEVWESEDAFEKFLECKKWNDKDKAKLIILGSTKREKGMHVGLKNLGATCYLNSLLQVWFHDTTLRQRIYSLPTPPSIPMERNPIALLQLTFANMQYGKRASYSPSKLVQSLGLKECVQQDSQEFSKLFLGMVESHLQGTSLQRSIRERFEGKIAYATTCSACKTESCREVSFEEIELHLKNNVPIETLIQNYLSEEILTSANQYFCSKCSEKRDASRRIKIRKLPSVLNFQLMRFVYDIKSMAKKKVHASVRFPDVLDMSQFVDNTADVHQTKPSDKKLVYKLTAVLVHKGQSANFGHYIAYVLDANQNQWIALNDETVTPLRLSSSNANDFDTADSSLKLGKLRPTASSKRSPPNNAASDPQNQEPIELHSDVENDGSIDDGNNGDTEQTQTQRKVTKISTEAEDKCDEDDEVQIVSETKKRKKTSSPKKGTNGKKARLAKQKGGSQTNDISAASDVLYHKSKNAYMLIYTLASELSPPDQDTNKSSSLAPSEEIIKIMEDEDKTWEEEWKEWENLKSEYRAEFGKKLDERMNVCRNWWISEQNNSETFFVPTKWIKNWLSEDFQDPPTSATTSVTAASKNAGEATTKNNSSEISLDLDQDEKTINTAQNGNKSEVIDLMNVDSSPIPQTRTAHMDNPRLTAEVDDAHTGNQTEEQVQELSSPAAAAPETTNNKLDMSSLICPHSHLKPDYISEVKRISRYAASLLQEYGYDFSPKPLSSNDLCRDCVEQVVIGKLKTKNHSKNVEVLSQFIKQDFDGRGYWISKSWWNEYRRKKLPTKDPSVPGQSIVVPPTDPQYVSDICCQHGSLALSISQTGRIVPPVFYDYLKELFPDFETFPESTPECGKCLNEETEFLESTKTARNQAEMERAELKSLYSYCNSLPSSSNATTSTKQRLRINLISTISPGPFYLISNAFLLQWKSYVDDPGIIGRPEKIDNGLLLCQHELSVIDVNDLSDLKSGLVTLLEGEEWNYMGKLYGCKNAVKCWLDLGDEEQPRDTGDGGDAEIEETEDNEMDDGENLKPDQGKRNERMDKGKLTGKVWRMSPPYCQDCGFERYVNDLSPVYNSVLLLFAWSFFLWTAGSVPFSQTLRVMTSSRKMDYVEAEITVRQIAITDDPRQSRNSASGEDPKSLSAPSSLMGLESGNRRSTRRKGKRLTVYVEKKDTVRDLKVEKLWYNGIELSDNAKSMGELGVVPGSELLLQIMDESKEDHASRKPEEGFKGTRLMRTNSVTSMSSSTNISASERSSVLQDGKREVIYLDDDDDLAQAIANSLLDHDENGNASDSAKLEGTGMARQKVEAEHAVLSSVDEWTCKRCTFANVGAAVCEICEGSRY
ncbi:hypothetical protein BKA69DRAFT_1122491 [Paraphysoderma sedebokerense]|nr:hypothetical protein BKA69DRAFT_1122491 [Paraphysoderma sedebokerense]